MNPAQHLELLCSSLDEQLWRKFLVAGREYLLASLMMAASMHTHIWPKSSALAIVKDWTGREVSTGKNFKFAMAEILFGSSWTALYGDDIANRFVNNYHLLNISTPPLVFKEDENFIQHHQASVLPTDIS